MFRRPVKTGTRRIRRPPLPADTLRRSSTGRAGGCAPQVSKPKVGAARLYKSPSRTSPAPHSSQVPPQVPYPVKPAIHRSDAERHLILFLYIIFFIEPVRKVFIFACGSSSDSGLNFTVERVFQLASLNLKLFNKIIMKTEERSSNSPRVRILVLGMISVGKSALTVRYLTRRYIGEYRSNTDLLYRQTVTINNSPVEVEIIDVSGETRDACFPSEQVQWADGCVVVYSITDRQSFQYATDALENLQKIRATGANVPVTLLGNKADLAHLRMVSEDEGKKLATRIGCPFHEVSVAENSSDLYAAFETLLNETKNQLGKSRKFSVTKMIGTLIGSAKSHPPPVPQSGTVVVCHKSDLHRSRVLKRRQNFTATASL